MGGKTGDFRPKMVLTGLDGMDPCPVEPYPDSQVATACCTGVPKCKGGGACKEEARLYSGTQVTYKLATSPIAGLAGLGAGLLAVAAVAAMVKRVHVQCSRAAMTSNDESQNNLLT